MEMDDDFFCWIVSLSQKFICEFWFKFLEHKFQRWASDPFPHSLSKLHFPVGQTAGQKHN